MEGKFKVRISLSGREIRMFVDEVPREAIGAELLYKAKNGIKIWSSVLPEIDVDEDQIFLWGTKSDYNLRVIGHFFDTIEEAEAYYNRMCQALNEFVTAVDEGKISFLTGWKVIESKGKEDPENE